MISVVIPLYNKEKQIANTLSTVLNQTFGNFEIVIVNDGSTDGSVEIVNKFSDSRIRLFTQANAGVSAARNRGIEEARGEFIAFLDADDEWDREYLASQMRLAQTYPECNVFAVNYRFRDNNGNVTQTIIRNLPFDGKQGVLSNYFEVASTSHPPICSISVMVRKTIIQAISGFPEGIKSGEDLLTWARLACYGSIAYSHKVLATFNVEGYDVKERPKRLPAKDDVVGRELAMLDRMYHTPGLKTYRAHWHKMRSSIYMRLRMRRKSIQEAVKGLRLNPRSYKLYAFIVLNLLPSKLQPF